MRPEIALGEFMKNMWHQAKTRGDDIGIPFLILGGLLIFVAAGFSIAGSEIGESLLGLGLALLSVGLGFIAVGMSAKADERQTGLLEKLDKRVADLPLLFKGDILTPSAQIAVKELLEVQSKEAAQRRLDEDTKRVGYVRGELFQNMDGSWSIHWGGKYPL